MKKHHSIACSAKFCAHECYYYRSITCGSTFLRDVTDTQISLGSSTDCLFDTISALPTVISQRKTDLHNCR